MTEPYRSAQLKVSGELLAEALNLPDGVEVDFVMTKREDRPHNTHSVYLTGDTPLLPVVMEDEKAPVVNVEFTTDEDGNVTISKWET